jgi:signal transduction histidine kinase/DNA-binding response OmpR family regulator/sugar lactone lactonase YvrE
MIRATFGSETNGGGLIHYDIQHKTYTVYRHDPGNPESLGNDVVVSLLIDHQNVLWVGTYHGGLHKHLGNGRFIRFKHDPSTPHTISDDKIWALHEDSRRKLWIGTLSKGIDTLDRTNNRFVSLRHGQDYTIYSDAINAIKEDSEGNIWVATADGITRIDHTDKESTHYIPDSNDLFSLSHDLVNSIVIDSRGLVWAGTMDGLNLYFRSTGNFMTIRKKDGLSDNIIHAILEDQHGNIWVSTANGITQIIVHAKPNPSQNDLAFDFFVYNEADGLQGRDFNINAAFKTQDGKLLFGGSNGFHIFAPEQIERNLTPPKMILTGFQIFNETIKTGQMVDNRVVLPLSFSKTDNIELKHHENVFSIGFAALNFLNPGKDQYAYMLEGFNKDWIYLDSEEPRRATYTNLDPGNYIFRVKASNNDGIWNEDGITLAINILPPFWKSSYAMVIYAIILALLLLLARYIVLQEERFNYRIEEQKKEAQRRHELDMLKIKFFTNISHELRTPLSLIISPVERTLKEINEGELKSRLETVNKNARRLMARVNQLLDFRRMETEEIRLNPEKTDIVAFLKETTYSFSDFSDTKNIRLTFESSLEELKTCVDRDKLEKIMFNLLSNAFKFTSENGTIQVTLNTEYPEHIPGNQPRQARKKTAHFLIVVKDNGIGIQEDKLERIFDRFFQNESAGSLVNQGSGIGLALCKEYVRLHGGSIHATSKVGQGSSFVVALPLNEKNDSVSDGPLKESIICQGSKVPVFHNETQGITDPSKPLLLLVEDNDDFRFYMKDNLRNSYNIIEASDGQRGLVLAKKHVPDLIITDLMMPEVDGYQLCKAIKTTSKTSHIPVVILTAQAMTEQQIAGFENGADDYLVKPFSMQLLEARIKNLLRFRKQPVKAWETIAEKQSELVAITSQDELFITRVVKHINSNLSNADYTVEDLSHHMCISRVHLYKKLMALSGMAPTDFIRFMRMKRAASLLKESQLNVAEVCYQVGYNDPKHFSMHFKKAFKATPTAYKKQFHNGNGFVNQKQQSG